MACGYLWLPYVKCLQTLVEYPGLLRNGISWNAAYLLAFLDSYGRYMEAGVGIEPALTALQAAA